MSPVQKIKGNHKTFKEVSETLFCNRVDLVFDVYTQKSIKNASRRSTGDFVSFLLCE